jgi:hypothetical protein
MTTFKPLANIPVCFLSLTDKKKCSNLFTTYVYCSKQFADLSRSTPMKVQLTEETTIQAVHTLFKNLATLRSLKPDDLLLPGRQTTYEKTLEETYAVIISLEKALDQLATELEYHQARIEQATSEVQGLY